MTNLKQSIDQVLNQPMDRKQFLASVGAVALGLIGITAVIRSLEQGKQKSGGYGSSPYGH